MTNGVMSLALWLQVVSAAPLRMVSDGVQQYLPSEANLSMLQHGYNMDGWPWHARLYTCPEISPVKFWKKIFCDANHLPSGPPSQSFPFTAAFPGSASMSTVWASHFTFHFWQQTQWICEDDGTCGLTVVSWGSPAMAMGDCFHLHCKLEVDNV